MSNYQINLEKPSIKEKIAEIGKLVEYSKQYETLAMIDLRKMPDALLQNLRKKLREGNEGGKIKVVKKAVAVRALEKIGKKMEGKKEECDKPIAFVFTNLSPYNLHRFFTDNYRKRAAKTGEIAPFEIVVPKGETDLPPGPALSELKAGGLNVQIKGGKIVVAKESTVAKEGDKITGPKAKALQKLNILPFESRAKLIFGYDGEYVYSKDVLASADTITDDIQTSFGQAFNLSVNAEYPTALNIELLLQNTVKDSLNLAVNGELYSSVSIELLLSSAARQGLALESALPTEPSAPVEEGKGEKKEKAESEENSEEKSEESK